MLELASVSWACFSWCVLILWRHIVLIFIWKNCMIFKNNLLLTHIHVKRVLLWGKVTLESFWNMMALELFFPFCFSTMIKITWPPLDLPPIWFCSYSSFSIMTELSFASVVSGLCRLESTCSDFFFSMWSCVLEGSLHLWAQSAQTASPPYYRFCVVAYKLELVKLWLSFSDLTYYAFQWLLVLGL